MEAGKLRHKLTIQQKTITTDAFGGAIETWSDMAVNVWASVEPLSGRELATAQSVYAETTVKITMRYLSSVIPAMRIVFEGRFYNIQSVVDVDMRHRELIILCSEGSNEG
jgi:SPP1 family predicted phage head-tail adaptor